MKEYQKLNKTIHLPNVRALDNFKSNIRGKGYGSISEGRCLEVALEASNVALEKGTIDAETVRKIARGDLIKLVSKY